MLAEIWKGNLTITFYFTLTEHFGSLYKLLRDGALHCDFLGHLANEMEACVAMTGCPGEDDVSFTIFSKHNSGYAIYEWQKDGTVRGIDSPFKVKMSFFMY